MSRRIEKINELLAQELAKLIHEEFSEEFGIITVNAVFTTPDLISAKVWIAIVGGKNDNQDIIELVNKKSYYFRHILTKKLNLRSIPRLEFILDKDIDRVQKIESLMDQIIKEKKHHEI